MKKEMNQTKAYKLLQERKSPFLSQVNDAINIADDMLPQINNVFNTYTIHGIKHAINVAEYMYELIDDAEKMSDLEIVVLIYVALFHDTGMIVSNNEIEEIKSDVLCPGNRKYSKVMEKYQDEKIALQECIRPIHGLRSKEFIEKLIIENGKLFLIPETTNVSFWKEVALICQAHNEDFSWLISNLRSDLMKGYYPLNAKYLAILLRISDYLDIDEQRAPIYLYKYLNLKEYSDLEWRQHFTIDNFDKIYNDEKTGLKEIVFQGQSDNPTIHRKLLKYFDKINNELLNGVGLCEKFENNKYLLRLKTNIVNKINCVGFTFSDFRLSLDYNAVTNLLMGEHIYGNRRYGLREIIQNSIDACKTMQETAETHLDFRLQKYEPFICIAIDSDRGKITVLDNGSGMSVDILKKYFLNVGVSYYKSDDYVLQGRKYLPIGHYGIGFLACFMLSDTVEVITRHINDNKITKIEFEKNSEYICLTYEDRNKVQGTEIVLDYEQFMEVFNNNNDEIIEFIEENFLNCDIPIRVIFQEKGQTRERKCKLTEIEKALPNSICLNKYLDGIEAYLDCNYKQINFTELLEGLNGNSSYYYDFEKNCMIYEIESDLKIKDFVKDGKINCISVPVIFDEVYEFEKAYDVLGDFNEALEKISDYIVINIMPLMLDEVIVEQEVSDDGAIIGNYNFKKFCTEFGHWDRIPTHIFKEKFNIICGSGEKILPYSERANFGGHFSFEQKDRTFIKNVLLSHLRITIPFLIDGVSLKRAIININNDNFYPNVSRDNISTEKQQILSYAIGKALHLWILDNINFPSEEKELLANFINKCYLDDNFCLKSMDKILK